MKLSSFAKEKLQVLSSQNLHKKLVWGLRFVRELEQGKETLRLDKANQVLKLFCFEVGALSINRITEHI
ncbi:MAG: hypothetical protein ACOVO1_00640 [Chitinophagaceae bacterium]